MVRNMTVHALGALAAAATAACGQAVLDNTSLTTSGDGYWQEGPPNYGRHSNGSNQSNVSTGLDYFDSRPWSYTDDGFSGLAGATNRLGYSPSSPGFGGAFGQMGMDLDTSAEIAASNSGHYLEAVYGLCENYIYFSLGQTTDWVWSGALTLTSSTGTTNEARYRFGLHDSDFGATHATDWVQSVGGAGDIVDQPFAMAGTLPAGSYVMHVQVVSGSYGPGVGASTAKLEAGLLSLTVPAPASTALLGLGAAAAVRRRR